MMRQTEKRDAKCDKHGPFVQEQLGLFSPVWSRCPACEREREQRENDLLILAEKERLRVLQEQKLDAAGIPERFRDRTLESYKATTEAQTQALKWATEYAYGFDDALATGRSMLFLGRPGTGKTHLACGICQYLMGKGITVYYTTVQRAMRRVKGTWSREADETEAQAIAAMTKPDLLVLDEIGVQFGSDTERNLLFDILNERYEKCYPTLLLSNYGKEDVAKYLGERVMDRLREDGGRVVVFDWDSHRRKM